MSVKNELRAVFREKRKSLCDKTVLDKHICENLLTSEFYMNAEKVFFYAALPDEINTDLIISDALSRKKIVALPVCTDKSGNMEFYQILSLSDLKTGLYGIREPDTTKCKKIDQYNNALCVVPGLSFDLSGYRLGYGKGYYDRFLKNFGSLSVGLCYNAFIQNKLLPRNEFDCSVDYIITENEITVCE